MTRFFFFRSEAIGFGMGNLISEIKYEDLVDIVSEINLNEFNGTRKLELRLVDLKKVDVSLGNK